MKKKETMADELVESAKNGTISFQQITDLIEMFIYLEKKLEEKDKEIALLQDNIIHFGERLKLVNDAKHRVCEEIREKTQYFDDCWRIKEILDEIEKGEITK